MLSKLTKLLNREDSNKNNSLQLNLMSVVVLSLVLGSLVLAIIDESFRPSFAEIVKLGLAGYAGSLMPRYFLVKNRL